MDLVKRLGSKYLGEDAMCLIQNDEADVSLGIAVMDNIYERSWFAIVAACGHSANSGLPGRKNTNQNFSFRCWLTQTSRLQEELLARRVLYFVDDLVFFRCRNDTRYEQLADKAYHSGWNSEVNSLARGVTMESPLWDFATILEYYTPRSLANEGDVTRALAGILRRVTERGECQFLQGIPGAALDAFILFRASNCLLCRRAGYTSYSWTGWKGRMVFKQCNLKLFSFLKDWLEKHTWIMWYKRENLAPPTLIWDRAPSSPSSSTGSSRDVYHGQRRPFQYPPGLRGKVPSARTAPTESLPFDLPHRGYPLLPFWTEAVFFQIKMDGRIAERRGIGTVDKAALAQGFSNGPVWKEIIPG
ncbi:uncharacterized protein MKZ38_001798 [Zalerion maritima]|uniref:Heterokaryon incompatibility domain-containing protein n=1 Tax=Zalerion maritima TaxID=339359 RepID=A0AAD5RZ12_9PEZI|nr:uncharacterized protein MKZ38_001798 [Zalerion maritima]